MHPTNLPCAVKMLKYMEVVRGLAEEGENCRPYEASYECISEWSSAESPFSRPSQGQTQAGSPCFALNRGKFCSVRFATIYDAIDFVKHYPQLVYMAKVDSESAFRIIPISPAPDLHGLPGAWVSFLWTLCFQWVVRVHVSLWAFTVVGCDS